MRHLSDVLIPEWVDAYQPFQVGVSNSGAIMCSLGFVQSDLSFVNIISYYRMMDLKQS